MDAKQRRILAERIAALGKPGASKFASTRRSSEPTAVDYALFPPRDAGAVARQHIAGVSPFTDAVVDTTTVAGMGLAQLHLDPLAEVYCARIGHHHPDEDNHGLPHGFLSGHHGNDHDGGDGHG